MSNPLVVHVVVAYHSGYGHTAKHAEAVALGDIDAGASTPPIDPDDIHEFKRTREETVDSVQPMTVHCNCTIRSYGNA